jgi:hypothetical protein
VRTFLDDDGGSLTCALPLPELELTASLAGGEGVRTLPYFHSEPQVQSDLLRLTLEDGLDFAELPPTHSAEFHGGRYVLAFEREGDRVLTVRRELLLPPFVIPADEYAIFAQFCARVDEAERAQLRFTRTAAAGPPGTGVPGGGGTSGDGGDAGPGEVDRPGQPR